MFKAFPNKDFIIHYLKEAVERMSDHRPVYLNLAIECLMCNKPAKAAALVYHAEYFLTAQAIEYYYECKMDNEVA